MEPFRDDNDLIAELAALRPSPAPAFAAELDGRAAAGFPRRSWLTGSPLGPRFARLRSLPPRGLILSGGAAALAVIAVATVIVAVSEPRTDSSSLNQLSPLNGRVSTPQGRPHSSDAGRHVETQSSQEAKPRGGEEGSGIQFEAPAPTVAGQVGSSRGDSSANAAAGIGSTASSSTGTGPFASRAGHREVEHSAEIALGADPDEVAGDAARVFEAVHAADGIVLSSSVSGGVAGEAGARFDLLIPAAKLSDALADFSAIDTVVSRHEASDDITAPTVRLGEKLRDSRATIDGLLVQLAGADSEGERAEVEAELSAERRRAASLRSRATKLDRRANLSRVSLRIETGAAATTPSDEGGGWGIGDAFGDAGHILAIAAGVTIVGLAILAPLALIVLLAWLANRTRIRRERERALS